MGSGAAGVVFDLDGTLVDTLEDIAAALNAALGALDLPRHGVGSYRMMIGDGVRALVERALPAGSGGELVEVVLRGFRERYARDLVVRTAPYPGVAELLDELAGRGVPLAVVSNKPDELTRDVVDRLLGRWPWRHVSGQRTGVPRKPDPTMALEAARCMGLDPGLCLFVGDSKVDMATARAAGMVPVGASWGFRDRAELVGHGALHVVDRPGEVLDLLGRKPRPRSGHA